MFALLALSFAVTVLLVTMMIALLALSFVMIVLLVAACVAHGRKRGVGMWRGHWRRV